MIIIIIIIIIIILIVILMVLIITIIIAILTKIAIDDFQPVWEASEAGGASVWWGGAPSGKVGTKRQKKEIRAQIQRKILECKYKQKGRVELWCWTRDISEISLVMGKRSLFAIS